MNGKSEHELVIRLQNGESEVVSDIFKLYSNRIYSHVFYSVDCNQAIAEDITQEVFIKAWKAIKSCGGKEHTFTSWLYRIAHNQVVDTFRKSHEYLSLEDPNYQDPEDIHQNAEAVLERNEILKVVSDLPDQQRQIILLKFLEGYDNNEIERITGKRQGAIRAIQMRALTSLRQRLQVEGSDYGR
jgi:RNA polymerase sigma-70 factor (ECF subfamily)